MTTESTTAEPDIRELRIDKFRTFLTLSGKRLTSEREAVARTAIGLAVPFCMDDVMRALDEGPSKPVSRASVFRTVTLLVDANVIEPTGDDRYF